MARRTRWLTGPVFGWRDVGVADLGAAVVLSVLAALLSTGWVKYDGPDQGVAAAVGVLAMTAPIAFARRAPVTVAVVLGAAAALNWLAVGSVVHCGEALPAVFYVAFVIGSRCPRRRPAAVGLAALLANVLCQSYSDPRLSGSTVEVLTLMAPIMAGFFIAGRLLRVRTQAVAALRARTAELRAQRAENARLAVAAEQVRIAGDLEQFLHEQIDRIAATSAAGSVAARPADAHAAFVAIQRTGRHTLTRMRSVVSELREDAPVQPQPVLAQLDRLLAEGTEADARLQVIGDPRLLPPGVELSGYRIVEHLLAALDDDPAARIDVVLRFRPDALELTVSGPSVRRGEVRAALAAAAERVAVHGGELRTRATGNRRHTVVQLPLVPARV